MSDQPQPPSPGSITGPVQWEVEGVRGYVTCPGAELHSKPTKPRDTTLFLDRVPTIFCLHTGCRAKVKAANAALRSALRFAGAWQPPVLDAAARAKLCAKAELDRQARRLALAKEQVLQAYRWPEPEIHADSPVSVTDPFHQFLSLFDPADVLWCGEPHESGALANLANFRPVARWREARAPMRPFTCPNPFKPGVCARSRDNLAEKKHMVVECDALHPDPAKNRDLSGAVFKYVLAARPELRLRAVVDSGNKSLHGWFTYTPEAHEWAVAVLPAVGVDAATLRLAQPVRCPGWFRRETGRLQSLLYLNP